jgi:pimeloyl-ACP methyl ester carboxylesterase
LNPSLLGEEICSQLDGGLWILHHDPVPGVGHDAARDVAGDDVLTDCTKLLEGIVSDTGYTKKNQAVDIAGVMDALKVQKADLVTHDIGNMVGYALAAQYPARVTCWVVIDAPLPGIGDWDNIVRNPALWHFDFRGPDEERLVQGLEQVVRRPQEDR